MRVLQGGLGSWVEHDFSTDQKGSFGSLDLGVVRSSAVIVFHAKL